MERPSGLHRIRGTSYLAVLLLSFALLLGAATVAQAATVTWLYAQPASGLITTQNTQSIAVRATAPSSGAALLPKTARMWIDGVEMSRPPLYTTPTTGSVYNVLIRRSPQVLLADGVHTVRAAIADSLGVVSEYSWSFTIGAPPQTSGAYPTGTVNEQFPSFGLSASDNSAGNLTATATLRAGSAVGAVVDTFSGSYAQGILSWKPSTPLDAGTYFASVEVVDATELVATRSWSFKVEAPDAMSLAVDCTSCHPAAPTGMSHPASANCAQCHPDKSLTHDRPTFATTCSESYCHPGTGLNLEHPVDAVYITDLASCAACHSASNPVVPQHIEADVVVSHATSTTGCEDCHGTDLVAEHAKYPGDSAFKYQCDTCHTSTDPLVVAAIAAGDTSCVACHASVAQGHDLGTSHAITAESQATCITSGCHDTAAVTVFEGRAFSDIHANASKTVGDKTVTSCLICHSSAAPTSYCGTAGCHADRLDPHGYVAEAHVANESCTLTCHAATAGMSDLKQLHDAATGTSVTCTSCHTTLVPSFASLYPAGWDKSCTACHGIADLHPTAAASHTGTDVAYQDASFFGNGCSDSTGHTGQSNCHDISNVALIHSTIDANGCVVCHGEGKTPSQECLSCHKPGSANTYTVPGAASADLFASTSPANDDSVSAGLTYTTTPAGQPIFSVVNTPWVTGTPARYVTITSIAAGGVGFGYTGPAIPSNAKITHVEVYARAKSTTALPARKMQGFFKIGGQTYLSSNQSGNLTTAWTATTGGFRFSTLPSRIDYSRETLYGELVNQNPATGLDWTPDELNGVDPDSSLQGFGVNVTASATANNISLAQIYIKVTYHTVEASVTNPTVGTHTYHQDNVKYLHDPSDMPEGQRFVSTNPVHGWYDALYYQDCYDFCHRGNGGSPVFSANQGTWMWYSVGGDPYDAVAATRTLSLRPIVIPVDSPVLNFDTNYQLGTGAAGYVEISTNSGTSWTPLTGTVGGATVSSVTGNAPGWVPASFNLSAYAGQTAQLRFRYVNGSSGSAGWAFDSMSIDGAAGTVFSDDAETLKPDWTNKYWTRSMGAFPLQ